MNNTAVVTLPFFTAFFVDDVLNALVVHVAPHRLSRICIFSTRVWSPWMSTLIHEDGRNNGRRENPVPYSWRLSQLQVFAVPSAVGPIPPILGLSVVGHFWSLHLMCKVDDSTFFVL